MRMADHPDIYKDCDYANKETQRKEANKDCDWANKEIQRKS